MSLVTRKRGHKTVHYVVVTWRGKRIWENAGTDKREAVRLEKRRTEEVKKGTYAPPAVRGSTVARHAAAWLHNRTARNKHNDSDVMSTHVLSRRWFATMRMDAVRGVHIRQLVDELKVATKKDHRGKDTGERISAKYVANIFGLVRTMFRDALSRELIDRDPCQLPRNTLARRSGKGRKPYPLKDLQSILTCVEVPLPARMFAGLAFFTGMREGEVCGRRWRDWDRSSEPLGCLAVETQYDDRPLKTDKEGDPRPRKVPVHPQLAAALEAWWSGGFELVYLRKPTEADFIVPRTEGPALLSHTRSSAYKMWRRALEKAGVTNLSLHSTRHTFISLARRNSPKDVVEKITHNARGDVVDQYTHRDWEELCAVLLSLPVGSAIVDGTSGHLVDTVEAQGIEPGVVDGKVRKLLESGGSEDEPPARVVPPTSAGRTPNVARVNDWRGRLPAGVTPADVHRDLKPRNVPGPGDRRRLGACVDGLTDALLVCRGSGGGGG